MFFRYIILGLVPGRCLVGERREGTRMETFVPDEHGELPFLRLGKQETRMATVVSAMWTLRQYDAWALHGELPGVRSLREKRGYWYK